MLLFCLGGPNNERISLELNEILDFPHRTSIEGGYDIICTLKIDVESYHVEYDKLMSATGALYCFGKQLKECYDTLKGQAFFGLTYENFFDFTVEMTIGGKAIVSGPFHQDYNSSNHLEFEFETNQSFFVEVIQSINEVKKIYGGYKGE